MIVKDYRTPFGRVEPSPPRFSIFSIPYSHLPPTPDGLTWKELKHFNMTQRPRRPVGAIGMTTLTCGRCQRQFQAVNPYAKTCSTACRTALYKARKRAATAAGAPA